MSAHYVRDKRSPKPSSRAISKVMSANKAKNTKPELRLRKALWKAGVKGYRRTLLTSHYSNSEYGFIFFLFVG